MPIRSIGLTNKSMSSNTINSYTSFLCDSFLLSGIIELQKFKNKKLAHARKNSTQTQSGEDMAQPKSKQERRQDRSDEINRKFTYLCEVVMGDLKELALRVYTEDYISVSQTVSEIDENVTRCVEQALAGLGDAEITFLKINQNLNKNKGITFEIKKHIFEYIETPATVVTLKGK